MIAWQADDPPDLIPESGRRLLLDDHVTSVDLRGARDNHDVPGLMAFAMLVDGSVKPCLS